MFINKLSSGATILAIASLLFVGTSMKAESATIPAFRMAPDGTISDVTAPTGNISSGAPGCFKIITWKDSYPATTTKVEEVSLNCTWQNDPWNLFLPYVGENFVKVASTSGSYWVEIIQNPAGSPETDYYIPFFQLNGTFYLGGFEEDFDANFNFVTETRFTDLDISGTSSVNIDVEYYIDGAEINTSISEFNPTLVSFSVALRPDTEFSSYSNAIDPLISGTSTSSFSFGSLADGTYDLLIQFSNLGVPFGSARPFPQSYIYTDFTLTGGVLTATGTVEYYDGLAEPINRYKPCSVVEISGCISNAMVDLFIPASTTLQETTDTFTSLQGKFPFAYVYDFQASVADLYSTSTASATIAYNFAGLGTLTLISKAQLQALPMASTVRTILGYLLWLMFFAQMYRRTLTIFNQNPV